MSFIVIVAVFCSRCCCCVFRSFFSRVLRAYRGRALPKIPYGTKAIKEGVSEKEQADTAQAIQI